MYSKPEIMEKMELTRASCRAELEFWNNITFLVESAGNVKELVFDMIRQASKKDGRILCISAEGKMESAEVRRRIRQAERKMIVIEHADILLTDEMRRYIAFDKTNQYLIMGRNTDSLLLSRANLYELDVTSDGVKTKIRLKSYRG